MEFLPKKKPVDEKKVAETATRRHLAAIKAGGIPTKEEPGIEEMDFEEVLTDLVPGGEYAAMAIPSQGVKKMAKQGIDKTKKAVDYLNNKTKRASEFMYDDSAVYKKFKEELQQAKSGRVGDTERVLDSYNKKVLDAEVDYLKKAQKNHPEEVSYVMDALGTTDLNKIAEETKDFENLSAYLEFIESSSM